MATRANLKTCKWKGGDEAKPGKRRSRTKHCVVKGRGRNAVTVRCYVSAERARKVARQKKGRVVKRKT